MAETIRVAVLGAAAFSEVAHIPGVNAHPNGEVVALFSRDLERAQAMAARAGVPEATNDLDALLARDDIHAVTVPSSNDNHYTYTMAALRTDKHVFCEKPMALTAGLAAEMTHEARTRGLVGIIAFIFRHTYCMQEVRRLVRAGAIGQPHYVSIDSQGQSWHRSTDATWRTYTGIHGAGQLGEMGSHFFDAINFTVGPTEGYISEVAAVTHIVPRTVAGPDGHAIPVETLDLASTLVRTSGGLQGQMITSRASASANPTGMGGLVVTGSEGALFCNFTRGDGEILRRQNPGGSWEDLPMPEGALDRKPHGIFRMLGGFIDAILHGAPNADQDGDFLDGYRSQSAIDATIKAGLSRQWVAVDTDLPGA
jgi:predicted dehydrogenase